MSKIALSGNASGTGTLTIAAPNTNSDFTLSLPATTAPILAGSGITLSASAPADTLVTTSDGNVGIGTSSPANRLTVAGATPYVSVFNATAGTSGSPSFGGIRFYGFSENTNGLVASVDAGNSQASDFAGVLRFSTQAAGGGGLTERARIDSSGNLQMTGGGAVNFSNNTGARPGSSGQYIVTADSGGFYQQAGGSYYLVTTAGGSTSDETLKKNMQPIGDALSKVCALTGYTFEFIEEPMCDADKGEQVGLGASNIEAQFPQIVMTGEDGKKRVRYDRLVAPLIEAIKELNAKVDAQAAEIAALKGQA